MPISDSSSAPRQTRGTPAVRWAIGIAVALHFLQWALFDLRPWLAFRAADIDTGWWRIATFPFVHATVWQLALVVTAIGSFGPPIERVWGSRRFAWFALWCALGAVLCAVLFAPGSTLIGGTAVALGTMYVALRDDPQGIAALFGVVPVRARSAVALLTAGLIALGLLTVPPNDPSGLDLASLSQLGGIVFAALYLRMSHGVPMERLHQHIAAVPDVHEDGPPRAIPRTQPRPPRERQDEADEIVARSKAMTSQRVVRPARRRRASPPKPGELDRVLDKISAEGIDSLTEEERAVLEDQAKRLKDGEA